MTSQLLVRRRSFLRQRLKELLEGDVDDMTSPPLDGCLHDILEHTDVLN